LAVEVTKTAAEGDAVAEEILDRAAEELAAMVAAVASRLGFSSAAFPLAMAGGALLRAEGLQSRVADRLRMLDLDPAPCRSVESPVVGAVTLARAEAAR